VDLKLHGKRALVCASSEGLGFAVAESLAREGCDIIIVSSNETKINDAASRLSRSHPQVKVRACATDLTKPEACTALVDKVLAGVGGIDILVNNVGGPPPSSALNTSIEDWKLGFDRLFLSSSTLTTGLVPGMRERGFGRVITITSISVLEPIDHLAISGAMRSAITSWSKLLSREVARFGVTVNCVMPGIIHTKRIEHLRALKAQREGTTVDEEMAKTAREIPAGRIGNTEELANVVSFLASPLASYVTGQNIAVDGGLLRGWT